MTKDSDLKTKLAKTDQMVVKIIKQKLRHNEYVNRMVIAMVILLIKKTSEVEFVIREI